MTTFACMAEDADHAKEQCLDSLPEDEVVEYDIIDIEAPAMPGLSDLVTFEGGTHLVFRDPMGSAVFSFTSDGLEWERVMQWYDAWLKYLYETEDQCD